MKVLTQKKIKYYLAILAKRNDLGFCEIKKKGIWHRV